MNIQQFIKLAQKKEITNIQVTKEKTKEEKIEDLNKEMQKAIQEQNFETAAIIRDEIKKLKEEK